VALRFLCLARPHIASFSFQISAVSLGKLCSKCTHLRRQGKRLLQGTFPATWTFARKTSVQDSIPTFYRRKYTTRIFFVVCAWIVPPTLMRVHGCGNPRLIMNEVTAEQEPSCSPRTLAVTPLRSPAPSTNLLEELRLPCIPSNRPTKTKPERKFEMQVVLQYQSII
jgi:hypothetical protein